MTMRETTRAAAVAALLLGAAACGGKPRVLDVYVWSDYLDPDLNAAFEREFGCTVVESHFSSNEELRAKLQGGAAGYDLVCPTDYAVVQLVKDGLLQPLRPENLPNLKNLAEDFRRPAYDPEARYAVPFRWGVTGIAYDPKKVDPAPTTWADLFDPAKAERLRGRMTMLDDQREVVGAALLSLGFSPNTHDASQIAAARERLRALKPLIAALDSDDPGSKLAQGESLAGHMWSGQAANAQASNPDVVFFVPKEGAFRYVDNWAVPKGAADADLAEKFIDYLHRPEVAAKLVNGSLYASCNAAADPGIEPSIRKGAAYSDGGGAPLLWVEDVGEAAALYAEAWTDLQTE